MERASECLYRFTLSLDRSEFRTIKGGQRRTATLQPQTTPAPVPPPFNLGYAGILLKPGAPPSNPAQTVVLTIPDKQWWSIRIIRIDYQRSNNAGSPTLFGRRSSPPGPDTGIDYYTQISPAMTATSTAFRHFFVAGYSPGIETTFDGNNFVRQFIPDEILPMNWSWVFQTASPAVGDTIAIGFYTYSLYVQQ